MKKLTQFLGIISLAAILIVSCKKKEENTTLDENTKQFNEDANDIKSESDNVNNDINSSINNTSIGGRNSASYSSELCGVTIDSSQIANKILFYNFDGITPCFSPSRTRGGQIKVELINGNTWKDVGAVLKMTYINFKVTKLSNNHSITFNGVKTLKNVNGINWLTFILSTSNFKFQERALNVQVAFHDGTQATWNSTRVTTWDYIQANATPGIPYGYVKFTSNGDTTLNNTSNTDSWGINRAGNAFITYYQSPWVSNSYCGFWRPNSGSLTHVVGGSSTLTVDLGVDQSGNASTLACAYGYKVTWTPSGGTQQTQTLSY
ncbi:MAG TPA: hypothetical protein PK323_01910 [Bacteroidia bacterium]|nr:hypothetical protein [Bacteroidia bacterium]